MFNPKVDKKCAKRAKKEHFPYNICMKKLIFSGNSSNLEKTQATFRKNSREYPKTQAK